LRRRLQVPGFVAQADATVKVLELLSSRAAALLGETAELVCTTWQARESQGEGSHPEILSFIRPILRSD
jgi:hypothetical protein